MYCLACRFYTPLYTNESQYRRSLQYHLLYADWIASKVFLKHIYAVCLQRAMVPQKKEKKNLQLSPVTSFLLCITYAHIDWYFLHPYQSLSMSSPYTDSLPFPSCLWRISKTGFKKDFHKCPLLQILHIPLYVPRAIFILTVKVIGGDLGIGKG